MYYNSLVGGAWCSGSTRDSDPLSVSSILIAPATKNTFAFADVFFYEAHLAVCEKSAELIFHFPFPIQFKSIKKASGTNSTRYFISIKHFFVCCLSADNVVGKLGIICHDGICAVFSEASDVVSFIDCPVLYCHSLVVSKLNKVL